MKETVKPLTHVPDRTVVGLDFGTQSARAVLVSAQTGEVLAVHTVRYSNDKTLHYAKDYEEALWELLASVIPKQYRSSVAGICVDATSLTLVPLAKDGRALMQCAEFAKEPHARIKLWKYHRAQAQAEEALQLAKKLDEPFLKRSGGFISCEWTLPKLMEIRDEAPQVYEVMDMAMDLCDFLTYRLTGRVTRSKGSLCYKGLWAEDLGFPSDAFLNRLRPGLAQKYRHLLRGEVLRPADCAGVLRREIGDRLGLTDPVYVAAGVLDGHTSLAALGALKAGDAALVVGTSNVLSVQTEKLYEAEGICGIARDGQIPDLYGIDSGQACTGDMLEWYLRNMSGTDILKEAEQKKCSPHGLLAKQITEPWKNTVVAVDWWNGSRSTPCDMNLHGGIAGLSLDTHPKDIYLALLQGIVCGTREIIDAVTAQGITIRRVLATGGMAGKNPLLMQEYANLLNRPVQTGVVTEGPALGAAVFAAVAAGLYCTVGEAYEHMGIHSFVVYQPDTVHRREYEALYEKNHRMRCLLHL